MFADLHTAILQRTIVVGDADRFVPLTLPAHSHSVVNYEITLESGERVEGEVDAAQLPLVGEVYFEDKHWCTFQLPLGSQLPLGYHCFSVETQRRTGDRFQPDSLPGSGLPRPSAYAAGGKTAGFNVALYGLRSKRNWGCGSFFTDLRALIEWSMREVGFSFVGLNPLHALHNRTPYNTSPYLPLSVYYKNLIYLDVEKVPEFTLSSAATWLFQSVTPAIQTQIQNLRDSPFVQYEEIDSLKKRFLRLLHEEFRNSKNRDSSRERMFAEYCDREGDLLHKFALYCALDQVLHEQDQNRWTWRDWPPAYQIPDSPESMAFANQHAATVEFYKYVQFLIDEQLAATQLIRQKKSACVSAYITTLRSLPIAAAPTCGRIVLFLLMAAGWARRRTISLPRAKIGGFRRRMCWRIARAATGCIAKASARLSSQVALCVLIM